MQKGAQNEFMAKVHCSRPFPRPYSSLRHHNHNLIARPRHYYHPGFHSESISGRISTPQRLTELKLSTYISNVRTTIGILQLGQIVDAHRQLNISWCCDDAELLNA